MRVILHIFNMKFLCNVCAAIILIHNIGQSSTLTLNLAMPIDYNHYKILQPERNFVDAYDYYNDDCMLQCNGTMLYYECLYYNKQDIIKWSCTNIQKLPKVFKYFFNNYITLEKPSISYIHKTNDGSEQNTLINISNNNKRDVIPIDIFSDLYIRIPITISDKYKIEKLQINCHSDCRPVLELEINRLDNIKLQISNVSLLKLNISNKLNRNNHNSHLLRYKSNEIKKNELQMESIQSIGCTVVKSDLPIVIKDNIYMERNVNNSNKLNMRMRSPNTTGKYVISRRKRANSSENRKKVSPIPLVIHGNQINCELNNTQRKLANSKFILKRKTHISNKTISNNNNKNNNLNYVISLVTNSWEFIKSLVKTPFDDKIVNLSVQSLINGIE